MPRGDWIPHREQDFVDLCQKWEIALTNSENITLYKWDGEECAGVLLKIRDFLAARAAYEANDSTANRHAKDEAKEDAKDAMRDFANTSVRFNKHMSEAAKLVMGIRPKDTTPTVRKRPTSQPDTVVENTPNHYEHKVKALSREGDDKGKPDDAYGVHFGWQVGGEKPATGADLPKSKFSRKTNLTVTHTEADKGKIAYYAACYENSKGDQGPWSPIAEAYIG